MHSMPERDVHGKITRTAIVVFLYTLAVCSYLARLESHTRADFFLPVKYHSIVDINSMGGLSAFTNANFSADELNTFYQKYVQQEGRPYTVRQDLLLSKLAHVKPSQGFLDDLGKITVQDLCNEIVRVMGDKTVDCELLFGCDRQTLIETTAGIGQHDNLGSLAIVEYFSRASGIAGYVLEKDQEITITFRGTDDMIDSLDNALFLPFNLSVQYADVRGLLAKYASAERIWLTGHSKGGHNAMYAASVDPRCRATGFNSPGFGIFLSDTQHDGLDFGVNYVINGDITGFLLFHLERRVVLETTDSVISKWPTLGNKHGLDNFFPIDNLTVATRILPLSVWSEWVTQLIWLYSMFITVQMMIRLITKTRFAVIKLCKKRVTAERCG